MSLDIFIWWWGPLCNLFHVKYRCREICWKERESFDFKKIYAEICVKNWHKNATQGKSCHSQVIQSSSSFTLTKSLVLFHFWQLIRDSLQLYNKYSLCFKGPCLINLVKCFQMSRLLAMSMSSFDHALKEGSKFYKKVDSVWFCVIHSRSSG